MNLVIKIGTAALSRADGAPDLDLLGRLAAEIAALKIAGHDVILVSSGAVGTGKALIGKNRPLQHCDGAAERQILAGLGQARLITLYQDLLAPHGLMAAQILLTRQDFHTRQHYRNIEHLFTALRQQPHILPVVNENDSVTADERMFTDNDQLAGLLATMMNADRMIILSHVEGVYDRPPEEAGARIIPLIDFQKKEGLPGALKGKSETGRGGMANKVAIARRMASLGIRTHIASARIPGVIGRLLQDELIGTTAVPTDVGRRSPVKRWLASEISIAAPASVTANACLAALMRESEQALSILPVGLVDVQGAFEKGDMVQIIDESGSPLALGVARYDAATLREALGKKQQPVFVHYDQLHRIGEE